MKRVILVLFLLLAITPNVAAQDPAQDAQSTLYQFSLEAISDPPPPLKANTFHRVELQFEDHSMDDTSAVGGPSAEIYYHNTLLTYRIIKGDATGWQVTTMPNFSQTYAGETREGSFQVKPQLTAKEAYMELEITATMRDARSGSEVTRNLTLAFLTTGAEVWNVNAKGGLDLAPAEVGTATITLTHLGLLPRSFAATVNENPCNAKVVAFPTITLDQAGRQDIQFSVQAPEEKAWYSSANCDVSFLVFPMDDPADERRVSVSMTVNGGFIDPAWMFNIIGVVIAALIIFLLVARRKARIEEEILGRPQKPWQIPVERVYLEHLKERDPQAHYVVRHFLMEEEYASSLLWYADFKKATKGTRAKGRIVISQEHRYERFQKRWQRRIAAPGKSADKLAAGLQKKLDRQGKAGARQERRKWKKLTKIMRTTHKNKVAKATDKWEKQVSKWEKQAAKAEKKGTAVPAKPEQPVLPEPDYPPEPTGDRILLATHKWNKKAVKARAKADKETGNLEVKFEKKDAKMLRKVRRKVSKVARKLDDPDFIEEHPLLAQSAE